MGDSFDSRTSLAAGPCSFDSNESASSVAQSNTLRNLKQRSGNRAVSLSPPTIYKNKTWRRQLLIRNQEADPCEQMNQSCRSLCEKRKTLFVSL